MEMNKKELLAELSAFVSENIITVGRLKQEDEYVFTMQPDPDTWNILQVIEHLNTYNNYYLPVINRALQSAPQSNVFTFKTGLLGNYFVKMMQPVDARVAKKYKAVKKHFPVVNGNDAEVITEYLKGQQQLLKLLHQATDYDVNTIKIPVSLNKFIKIKLGDAFRFIIVHQQRHFVQIGGILNALPKIQLKQAPL